MTFLNSLFRPFRLISFAVPLQKKNGIRFKFRATVIHLTRFLFSRRVKLNYTYVPMPGRILYRSR